MLSNGYYAEITYTLSILSNDYDGMSYIVYAVTWRWWNDLTLYSMSNDDDGMSYTLCIQSHDLYLLPHLLDPGVIILVSIKGC